VLRAAHSLLDHDLAIELGGFINGRTEFLLRARLRDSYRRAQVGRLHEHGILQLAVNTLLGLLRVDVPVAAQNGDVLHDRQAGGAEQRLHDVLVHARG